MEQQAGYLWFSEGVPNLVQSLTGLHLDLTYPNLAPHICTNRSVGRPVGAEEGQLIPRVFWAESRLKSQPCATDLDR